MGLRHLVAGLALWMCACASLAATVSFEDLARHPQYREVKISPDGTHLAAKSVLKNGQTVLTVLSLQGGKSFNVKPRESADVLDFWWASPDRVLFTEAEHEGGWDVPLATGELWAVSASGHGSADLLFGVRALEYGTAQFISRIAGDPKHVLVAITDWTSSGSTGALSGVYKMDVRNGQYVGVVTAPMRQASFLADHRGNVWFASGDDLKGDRKIYMRAGGTGDWQLLAKASSNRDWPVAFSADDSVVWFACPGAEGGFGVCRFDPATKQMTNVWSNPDVEMDGLEQGLAHDSIMGVRFVDGRPALSVFDARSPDAQALIALMKQYPGEDVQFTSGTDDGSKAIALVQADVDPGTYFMYDRASNKFTPILQRASWIDPTRMARKQPITLSARDGLKLHGYISYPPGQEKAKNLPMVAFVHGGPYGIRDDWSYDPYVQAMAMHGYAVLQVNYRGSGGYGYAFEEAGYHEWGGKMQDDVTDATRWAIAQGIADPNRICIYGGSYGGYAALEGAVKESNLYKCAIGYVGVYDLREMVGREDVLSFESKYWKRTVGTDDTVLAQHSPIYQLDNLKAKVMLIVGGKDEIVLPQQGKDLHKALLKRHVPHEWLYMRDEWHGFYKEENVAELYSKVDAFLDANIGAGAASGAGR
ncbi:MAG TPA: prolyl oligopeptidase family serine peptidase [Oleiagrimonas sp.]|nr:prolyl oligopeptidase family serine peptidase [Oleiagrimonas sp.]